jgi:ABC-type glutathione transport system ATPase component
MTSTDTKTTGAATAAPILQIKNLNVTLHKEQELIPILHHVNLTVHAGEIVGLVGESGSGKSMTASAVTQLLPGGSKSLKGSIVFCGEELTTKSEKEMSHYRGKEIAMIFQEPMTCLNPVFTVGAAAGRCYLHSPASERGSEAHARAVTMLEKRTY